MRRLGLRARVAVVFTAGAFLLSTMFGLLTYVLARKYLIDQREASAQRQTYVNARLVAEGLRGSEVQPPDLLASLQAPESSQSLLRLDGEWFTTSVDVDPAQLPPDLVRLVVSDTPAAQRFSSRGVPRLAIAVPLPAYDAAYVEVVNLSQLESTLRVLGFVLIAGAVATTAAGAAAGAWAARRLLEPVEAVARTAAEIAGGRLDARLPSDERGDLAVLATSFNRMVEALEARIQRDARFASDVSHELRSPLTTLSTAVAVLANRSRQWRDASSREAVELVAAEISRFERLVEDLLEIARFDAGRAGLALEEVRLAELVRQAVARSPHRDVPVTVEPRAEDAVVLANKPRLERVLGNLLDNADVHGGGSVTVTVRREDDSLLLLVDDRGPGVPPADRERVFERFARSTGASRSDTGVGLGLALVAEHVAAHGGTVHVTDRPGGGARFVVCLPAASP